MPVEPLVGKKVFIGLSGGVDSSVASYFLLEQGAEVVGVYMKNWAGEDGLQDNCPWLDELESAKNAADKLGISFRTYNFEKEYKERVLDNFFSEYRAGRTPNPDILCNSQIKFQAFMAKAISEGADLIATGHYAGIIDTNISSIFPYEGIRKKILAESVNDKFLVHAKDKNKDQTYFLSGLTQQQLAKAVFPLSNITKPEVRSIAKELGLANANRKDSQGICFIGELSIRQFLRKYLSMESGEFKDIDSGKVLGVHDGLSFYTIGQREGLRVGGSTSPYYVAKKDLESKTIFLAKGHEHPSLYSRIVYFSELTWTNNLFSKFTSEDWNSAGIRAVIRYRGQPTSGQIDLEKGKYVFSNPQWAVAPGQSIVFEMGDVCLGRAVIDKT